MHRVRIFENIRGSRDAQHKRESLFITIIRPIIVELVGTFLLVTFGLWGGCSTSGNIIQGAFSFGCTLMVLLASFGHISGTHLNPCVTLGVFIAGEVRYYLAIIYVIMQIIAGIGAAGLVRLLVSRDSYTQCHGGATLLNKIDMIEWWQGLIIEFFITFLFVTVILLVALDTKSKTGLAPLLIGFTLVGNILTAGSYTGASLNPARSLGPAIVANQWTDHWIYWIGPLLGGTIAGIAYRFIWAHQDRRWPKPKSKKLNEASVTAPIL
ncbi:unnamed protein product [Adineta steineri]|uniref:Aquaporin n=2 Tax=Adineta steineri TaxID=433720 RepID=A0A818IFH3_9BILA|nr:unnamed protein product [Adineta steineri]CAF3521748.1 unnamed protein product [Adineta steineri]